MNIGIAGVDATRRVDQAHAGLGIAGEAKDQTQPGAMFGISGVDRTGKVAIVDNGVKTGNGAVGIAGNLGSGTRVQIAADLPDVAAFKDRDQHLAHISKNSGRLGDRAAREAWKKGVWFSDFTYLFYPKNGQMVWRKGREQIFSRSCRSLPVFYDSCGYRGRLTGTAQQWVRGSEGFNYYNQAIELGDPDAYSIWDHPLDRKKTLHYTRRMMSLYPHDVHNGRMWPVFSIRWAWDDSAHLNYARLPGWASRDLSGLIPLNKTQRQFKPETREKWVRLAIANALQMAQDPDFRWMVNSFGHVMLGGMVGSKCPRLARHIFAATLCHIFPDCQFWLLGQANFAVINGLGKLGLLNQCWTDGTWWILDATCERMAYVEDGLITMLSLETTEKQKKRRKEGKRRQSFFTLTELMAANLRSLLAAYQGLWVWPPPEPLPLDLMDIDQVADMKQRVQMAQMELNL